MHQHKKNIISAKSLFHAGDSPSTRFMNVLSQGKSTHGSVLKAGHSGYQSHHFLLPSHCSQV